MAGFRPDHLLVRDYVTAHDHLQYTQLPADVVAVHVTHSNLPSKMLDIRFNLHTKIYDVKDKLRTHIGTPPEYQRLILKQNGSPVCEMNDNTKMLGFYSVVSGMEIHIIDNDPFSLSRGGGLTDTSLIEKYKISDEAYDKRSNTIRQYIKDQRAKDPNFKLKPQGAAAAAMNAAAAEPPPGPESVAGIEVGMRCEVMPGKRRGTVMFVGDISALKEGPWVGVKLDEPVGKNDGTVKGERIFECGPAYGTFVRGKNITVGDFPERDLLDSDDENAGNADEAAEEDEEL